MNKSILLAVSLSILGLSSAFASGASGASGMSFHHWKYYNVAMATANSLPAVGSRFINPNSGATLQYNKVTGKYRVEFSNYGGHYLNLQHKGNSWVFPISRKDGEKARAILINQHPCSKTNPNVVCEVQTFTQYHWESWITHSPAVVYAQAVRVTRNPPNVYMDVLAVGFDNLGKRVIVQPKLPVH